MAAISKPGRVIVIGASAGGFRAVACLLRQIDSELDAAIFVVVHAAFEGVLNFDKYLGKKINLPVKSAAHKQSIERGVVYLSVADQHLYLQDDEMLLSKGPRENLFRPSIDVLFRSAAVAFSNRCIGILLTGRLNDGTAGLIAIKKCGGITGVQDPKSAEFSEMPSTAIREANVDFVLDVNDIGKHLNELCRSEAPAAVEIPEHVRREAAIALKIKSQISTEEFLGEQVPLSCSSCGGPLWKIKDKGVERYRCHVGHSFSQEALLESQESKLEETLWVSLRTFEEKKILLNKMISDYRQKGFLSLVKLYESKVSEVSEHISRLRELMQIAD